MTWLSHPDLPDQFIEVDDGAVWHYARSGWVESEPPAEPTTAELDAQLLAPREPKAEAEPEAEPPPAESAEETELQPVESDE